MRTFIASFGLALSCLIGASAFAAGVDEMEKAGGLPVYGEGSDSIRVGVLGKGKGLVLCNGDVFTTEDAWGEEEGYEAFIRDAGKKSFGWTYYTRMYSSKAGSLECAINKTVMMCAFENDLSYCEENVQTSSL